MEMARCMVHNWNVPYLYWIVVNTVIYILNKNPFKDLQNTTPEDSWSDRKLFCK